MYQYEQTVKPNIEKILFLVVRYLNTFRIEKFSIFFLILSCKTNTYNHESEYPKIKNYHFFLVWQEPKTRFNYF